MDGEVFNRAAALKAIMKYRKLNMKQLGEKSGINPRTIEGYYYGRKDMAEGKAYNIVQMAHALDIDARILTGALPPENFFVYEKIKLKNGGKTLELITLDNIRNAYYMETVSSPPENSPYDKR